MQTYILRCATGEYYCGRTHDINRRIQEHIDEKYPHWFANKERKNFRLICLLDGNFEYSIKRFRIYRFVDLMRAIKKANIKEF
jgi:predicted GIY-YIG superfamily endonuclease